MYEPSFLERDFEFVWSCQLCERKRAVEPCLQCGCIGFPVGCRLSQCCDRNDMVYEWDTHGVGVDKDDLFRHDRQAWPGEVRGWCFCQVLMMQYKDLVESSFK